MPAYNAANFITESIQSIQNQTYSNWELRIIDDRSTDGTIQIIETYAALDARIKPVYLPTNQGAGVVRNIGIKASEGKYISFFGC